jgi:RNA polymerase sigma-70 factor (ECF subfamily)
VAHLDPLERPELLIGRVYAYVAYRIGSGPDAEDITSETFARALRYRSRYEAKRGRPVTWLTAIARSLIADWVAARPAAGQPYEPGYVDDFASDVVARTDIRRAVAGLADRDRELIALRYGADLPTKQIALLLGEDSHTIDVALSRARARLRERIKAPRDGEHQIRRAV